MPSSVSKSDRCACGRPASQGVCCLLCIGSSGSRHEGVCDEAFSKESVAQAPLSPLAGTVLSVPVATAYRPGAVTDSASAPSCPTCKAKLGEHHASTCSAGWGQVLPSEIPGYIESIAAKVTAAKDPCACDPSGPCLEHEPEEPNTDHVVLDYQTNKICCGHTAALRRPW